MESFDGDGALDSVALERFCDTQVRDGATALVVCGTTGEAPTLSRTEHDQIVRIAVEVANGRIPVIAGAGSNSTSQAIELAKEFIQVAGDGETEVRQVYEPSDFFA